MAINNSEYLFRNFPVKIVIFGPNDIHLSGIPTRSSQKKLTQGFNPGYPKLHPISGLQPEAHLSLFESQPVQAKKN
jgi:hypothetical protein